ncbi:hypothetical protein EBU71_00430 [bacterium]|nr:hypothetical protein [Candidatus Elulimicrobium humile]
MQFYIGRVENRNDPLKLGRCQVRVIGVHDEDVSILPTVDLPWAMPVSSINSAASAGIGISPTGITLGSVVLIGFTDKDQQVPVIFGTLAGIPQNNETTLSIKPADRKVNTASSIGIGSDGVTKTYSGEISNASLEIQDARPFSTFSVTDATVNSIIENTPFSDTPVLSKIDGVDTYTIGYGQTSWQGLPVSSTYPGSVDQPIAVSEFKNYLNDDVAANLAGSVRGLVNQEMFDSVVDVASDLGVGAFKASSVLPLINSADYAGAAGAISGLATGIGVDSALSSLSGISFGGSSSKKSRRTAAAKKFTSVGTPKFGGELFDENTAYVDPIGTNNSSGNAGTKKGVYAGLFGAASGYVTYTNEPDTSRLARHENIDKTSVYQKEAARAFNLERFDYSTWDAPEVPYNAEYPFNKVIETESGHVFEMDDTPNAERINLYHRRGSWHEWDSNGTLTDRVAGDRYVLNERNTYEVSNGSKVLTVYGELDIVVKNGGKIRIDGPGDIQINNDCNLIIAGNLNANVAGNYNVIANNILMEAKGTFSINGENLTQIDGAKIEIGEGYSSTGLAINENAVESPIMPVFSPLIVNSRSNREQLLYETPDEGDAIAHRQRQITRGLYLSKNLDLGTLGANTIPVSGVVPSIASRNCELIDSLTTFDPSLQLSARIQLAALNRNGGIPIIDQLGVTKSSIVCNLKGLCEYVLEPAKDLYANLIILNGFRNKEEIPGAPEFSQHYVGEAVDIRFSGWNRAQHVAAAIALAENLPYGYDRIVLSYAGAKTVWLHISWKYDGNRYETFTVRDHLKIADGFTLISEV